MLVRQLTLTVIITILLISAVYDAQAITGNEWKQWSEEPRKAYILGVLDTWQIINAMSENATAKMTDKFPGTVAWPFIKLVRCTNKGMTYGQLYAIVNKYIEDNPSQWHYSMASLVWTAIDDVCKTIEGR